MKTKKIVKNELIESVGRIQQSLGITPNKEDAEVLTNELQKFIEGYLHYRSIEDIKPDNDEENLVLRY